MIIFVKTEKNTDGIKNLYTDCKESLHIDTEDDFPFTSLSTFYTLWHKNGSSLLKSIENRHEKLPEIPRKKQAVYRDRGRGTERRAGVRTDPEFIYH